MTQRLTKLDSSVLDEVMDMLDNPEGIKTREALRLTLKMMSGVYLSQNEVIDRVEHQNGRVKKLEEQSIIRWIKENQKKALLLGFIFIGIFISDLRHPIINYIYSNFYNLLVIWIN